MELVTLLAAAILSLTLCVAALAKLRNPGAFFMALPGFGISDRLGSLLARILPLVELALAIGIWIPALRFQAAIGAALLMLAFVAVILPSILRGQHLQCACFGSVGSGTLSAWSVLRNILLGAAGVIIATTPVSWDRAVAQAGGVMQLASIVAAMTFALVIWRLIRSQMELLESHGRLLLRVDALEAGTTLPSQTAVDPLITVGEPAPKVQLDELDHASLALESLWQNGTTVLMFTNPSCQGCRDLMETLAPWSESNQTVTTAVVSPATQRRSATQYSTSSIRWLVDRSRDVFEQYGVTHTPTVVVVASEGTVRSVARGADQAKQLLAQITLDGLALGEVEVVTPVGDAIPAATILDGRRAMLFWNPKCGFCKAMQPALESMGSSSSEVLDLVSCVVGGPPAPGASPSGLRNVVFDPTGALSTKAGSPGTPSLIWLENDGVSQNPVTGADAILAALADLQRNEQEARTLQ